MDDLSRVFETFLPPVEAEMWAVMEDLEPREADLFGYLRYHLGWADTGLEACDGRSGKRIRPILCLLACDGCGGGWEDALPAAAAIELLHNFTLIHDDIEDGDRMRRGRPTVWSVWGQAQGINAGDTLFSASQLALLRLRGRGIDPDTVVEASRLFNETCVSLTHGQYLDIGFETRADVSVDEYLTMVEGKTAALIACSCELGALVAEGPPRARRALRAYGRHAGLAFQMQDDVLGIWGVAEVTGKPVGADIARRKKTLPLLHGLERSEELRALLSQAKLTADDVRRASELLEDVGSRAYAEGLAAHHYDRAVESLGEVPLRDRAAESLRRLAHKLIRRKK
jgi:geranylgeranyl diphosphate synthase type I